MFRSVVRGLTVALGNRPNSTLQFPPNLLALQVAKIVDIKPHENASKLYVSQAQIAPDTTIQICSGLVPFIPLEKLLHAEIVILTNLKTSKMRGEISEAMLLAASKEVNGETRVEIVRPPPGSSIGDKLAFEGFPLQSDTLKNLKSKQLQEITKYLQTNEHRQVVYVNDSTQHLLKHENGKSCCVDSLENAEVH